MSSAPSALATVRGAGPSPLAALEDAARITLESWAVDATRGRLREDLDPIVGGFAVSVARGRRRTTPQRRIGTIFASFHEHAAMQ